MNILAINLDKGIFKKNSASRKRLEEYAGLPDKLFVIVWTKNKEKPIFSGNKLFIYSTNSRFKIFYYLNSFLIAGKIIRSDKIDLIFTQDPYETGLAGWLLARRYKIPLQFQIHTDFLSPYFWKESFLNKIRVLLAKFLIPRANCIRVVSERIQNSLVASGYTLNPITVLPIFVDARKIQKTPIIVDLRRKYPQFDFIILMASRLTKEKNIVLAIEALAEVVKKYPKTGLIVAGEGPERQNLEFRIKNLGLDNNIKIENWVNYETLISYYKTADLFLLTSNYEGYGMSAVEAMAAGCPTVMTDVGLAGEILIDKENGLVIPIGDCQKLTEAILSLIENSKLRIHLADNAKKIIDFWPTKDEYLKEYYKSWASCLAIR